MTSNKQANEILDELEENFISRKCVICEGDIREKLDGKYKRLCERCYSKMNKKM